jgi:hypothetical protein
MAAATAPDYPFWKFYPSRSPAPTWVSDIIAAFSDAAPQIDSRLNRGLTSDAALALLRPRLVPLGFDIEVGKTTMRSYERTRDQIDAIYASERLRLPFRGILLIGY